MTSNFGSAPFVRSITAAPLSSVTSASRPAMKRSIFNFAFAPSRRRVACPSRRSRRDLSPVSAVSSSRTGTPFAATSLTSCRDRKAFPRDADTSPIGSAAAAVGGKKTARRQRVVRKCINRHSFVARGGYLTMPRSPRSVSLADSCTAASCSYTTARIFPVNSW